MYNSLFFAQSSSSRIHYLQQWTGDVLKEINYVSEYEDLLHCYNKIILIEPFEADFRIDLVRQLIKQNNYLVFYGFIEASESKFIRAVLTDLPNDFNRYAIVGNSDDHKQQPSINVYDLFHATLSNPNRLRATETLEKIYHPGKKPFKFLYLNGEGRPHRQYAWHEVNQRGLLDHALWTWLDGDQTTSSWGFQSLDSDNMPVIPKTYLPVEYESTLVDYGNIPKYQHNWRNFLQLKKDLWVSHWISGHIVPAQYNNTYFGLIAETNYDGQPFITEKTYKSLLAGHPFIIISSPGFYQELHRLGFQTFPDLIDESFDQEPNHQTRIKLIVDQVEKLCHSDLDSFLDRAKEICVYNHNHYIATQWSMWYKTHIELDRFFRDVLQRAQN